VLLREYVPPWLKFGRPIECTDMEMRFRRQWPTQAFAGQRRAAPGTKSAPRSSRRRIELRYFALGDRISRVFECDKNRSRRAAVLAATLTVAPIHAFWLTGRNKTDRATQATTFELLGYATHNSILSSLLARRFEDITVDRSAESHSIAEFIFLTKLHGMYALAIITSRQIRASLVETTC
jgi:hypothetical protein